MRKRGSTSNLSRRVDWLDTGADPVTLLGRTVRINYPDGGVEHRYFSDLQPSALHHETGQSVFPGGTQLPLRSKVFTRITDFPFLERESFAVSDGLARPVLSGLRNGPNEMDWTQTVYDGSERVSSTSNPRTAVYAGTLPSLTPNLFTTTRYDGLDRTVEVETPDGEIAATVFDANRFTVTDQSGAARRSTTDGLGRIIGMREPDPQSGLLDPTASNTGTTTRDDSRPSPTARDWRSSSPAFSATIQEERRSAPFTPTGRRSASTTTCGSSPSRGRFSTRPSAG